MGKEVLKSFGVELEVEIPKKNYLEIYGKHSEESLRQLYFFGVLSESEVEEIKKQRLAKIKPVVVIEEGFVALERPTPLTLCKKISERDLLESKEPLRAKSLDVIGTALIFSERKTKSFRVKREKRESTLRQAGKSSLASYR